MRTVLVVTILVVLAATYFALPTLLQSVGNFLVVSDPLQHADAVVVIGGDGIERIEVARRLLHDGYGRWLIVSGGPYGPGFNSALTMQAQALSVGISGARILVDDRAESTQDNARGSARLMVTHGLRTAILLTAPYHTRRAVLIFARIFHREGLRVGVLAVDDGHFKVERWWTRGRDRGLVLREYVKLLAFGGGLR